MHYCRQKRHVLKNTHGRDSDEHEPSTKRVKVEQSCKNYKKSIKFYNYRFIFANWAKYCLYYSAFVIGRHGDILGYAVFKNNPLLLHDLLTAWEYKYIGCDFVLAGMAAGF